MINVLFFFLRCDLIISSSKYAGFADGAAVVRQGDTSVLVTVVGRPRQTPASFLPLTVDYRQKAAAAGRIPTSHHRRDTPPTEQEILTSRVIDRSLRPLFLSDFNNEIQVITFKTKIAESSNSVSCATRDPSI